jgi:hypothetical protein
VSLSTAAIEALVQAALETEAGARLLEHEQAISALALVATGSDPIALAAFTAEASGVADDGGEP